MFPSNPTVYPVYVPDQVLTAHDLNESFTYLDEQQRLTRVNLIGIGIVCGLQVVYDNVNHTITIRKGTGVTSEGYLVRVEEKMYRKAITYANQLSDMTYDPFVNNGTPKTKKFDLWELVETTDDAAAHDLLPNFLDDPGHKKIVLLFVELLDVKNKNCDPNSCDDKGTHYEVTIRPLLVSENDAINLPVHKGGVNQVPVVLPEIRPRRFDVPSGPLFDTEDVLSEYLEILNETYIRSIANALKDTYTKLAAIVEDTGLQDPAVVAAIDNIPGAYNFLYNGTIGAHPDKIVQLQYYHDFFADLVAAYVELREKSCAAVCECCPDYTLFPRHLMLGEAIGFDEMTSSYRQRFISSSILCCCSEDVQDIRILFRRLLSMIANFSLPNPADPVVKNDPDLVRITPSILGPAFLSEKAIPFYYNPNNGTTPLYLSWNAERTVSGTANYNLSYNARRYNIGDEFVYAPLKYDLEPYNFLRIEGHAGQDYEKMLEKILHLRKGNRLPFDVIAVSSDLWSIFNILSALRDTENGEFEKALEEIKKHPCCFSDIFLMFDDLFARMLCCLLEQSKYYLALPSGEKNMRSPASRRLMSALYSKTEAEVDVENDTVGVSYAVKAEDRTIDSRYCSEVFLNIATGNASPVSALVIMPYKIERLAEAIPDHITELNFAAFEERYEDLVRTAQDMRKLYASENVRDEVEKAKINRDQLISRLQFSCITCLMYELKLLVKEFLLRLLRFMLRQKLGYYATLNPGIQHKAGVTMGGTFILVYHQNSKLDFNPEKLIAFVEKLKGEDNVRGGKNLANLKGGGQTLLSSFLMQEEWEFLVNAINLGSQPNPVLDPVIAQIPEGTVIADFYLPYLCCSDCPPVSYVFAKAPASDLSVTQSIPSCDITGTNFTTVLTITGGTPPYKIDGVAIGGNISSVTTPSGQSKTVQVQDNDGQTKQVVIAAHTCPPPLTAIISDPQCNNAGTLYSVTITLAGGVPPYTANGVPVGTSFTETVPSGSGRSWLIRDSSTQQVTKTIAPHTCPVPMVVTLGVPQCDANGQNFSVAVMVTGGIPPYRLDAGAPFNSTTTVVVPSGTSKTMILTDNGTGNKAVVIPSHTCPQPCNLPCEGLSERCAYVLWLQKPLPGTRIKHQTKIATLELTDENGVQTSMDVTPEFKAGLDANPLLTAANFDARMKAQLNRLNAKIPSQFSVAGIPVFNYDPATQLMSIETFNCQTVRLRLESSTDGDTFMLSEYDSRRKFVRFRVGEQNIVVRATGCVRINKCNGTSEVVCNTPISEADIIVERVPGVQGTYKFRTEPVFPSKFWSFRPGLPSMTDDIEPVVRIEGPSTFVRVVVMNSDGCFLVVEKEMQLPLQ